MPKFESFIALVTNEKTGETEKVESLKEWINNKNEIPYNVVFAHQCEFCGKILLRGNICSKCYKTKL